MLTYTVPFFGYVNDTYFFKGTSGIDIDLRRVDIDQCPLPPGSTQLNIFAASDKCKKRTTEGEESQYAVQGVFECLPCAEGCESCEDGSPCIVSLNWLMRTAILILECCIIACLPVVVIFTWKYGNVKVVRAASPVLLRVIALGAFFIYCTTIVMYPRPNVVTCTVRVWLREIGFSLTYGALMLKTWRISVIFRVKSAKAVKITDMNLLKRLGIIVTIFSVFLGIRTLVAPPVVIVARTADDLKAYLCRTDWWDHSFTTLEVMFLVWGIRLCIVVRKAPSEFNESRFISMAIYNEFLLSVFLNVSMLFLQSPANPDLLYIIFFCHTQLTVTLLLCLIFGSKAYVVFRGDDKEDSLGKLSGATGKFVGKSCRAQGTSNQTNSISLQQGNFTEDSDGVTEEFRRLCSQLEHLKERNMRSGNRELVAKITAMQEAANRAETQVSTIQAICSSLRLNSMTSLTTEKVDVKVENGSGWNRANSADSGSESAEKKKSTKKSNSLEDSATTTSSPKKKDGDGDAQPAEEADKKGPGSNGKVKDEVASREHQVLAAGEEVADAKSREDSAKERKSKSGHARTHAIVINLDDKSRFSEEVTV
ncbi:probable G-protein coupled receptor CG31760 isoform X2 [Orussus abietinus]|uniref:probable G-protein coupled receptor CG31760 isoform X2 n=1 Tax=Orussus abietinus TaxID=222816 RepID=UPI00062679D8|nr:probable G-protein coupled receptor CG31760 isoform X2 [Orussus abietinus]